MARDYRELFQRGAESYDTNVFVEGTFDYWIWQREQAYLLDVLRRHFQGRTINYLDFACGPGRIVSFLEPHVTTSTAIDVAQPAIDLARRKLTKTTLVCGDLTRDASLLTGPFDLITTFRFFLNAQESLRHEAIAALARVLAEDGLLVIGVHGNDRSLRAISSFVRRRLLRQPVHSLTYREMERLLAEYGLRIVELHGITPMTRRVWAAAPEAVRNRVDRMTARSRVLQRLSVTQVIVAAHART